jgi:hypothetical protein
VDPIFSIPTSTIDSLRATVGAQFTDPGLLLILVVAVALPLTFWIVKRVVALFPKGK